ncbi:hypothetical protein FACS189472_10540 [Alphaproteobacteria bacterium]|nr:hypothetical protein FACS189472_10540 [Alphaproteobacteria bacterium]
MKQSIITAIFFIIILLRNEFAFALGAIIDPVLSLIKETVSSEETLSLKKVMFSIEENMNNRGAVKFHLVIAYEQELAGELSKMSAKEYFRNAEQFKKDHPDKIKIFKWEIKAEKKLSSWIPIKHNTTELTPIKGFLFASYDSIGDHRIVIPPSCEKMKILLKEKEFEIENSDKPKKESGKDDGEKEKEEKNIEDIEDEMGLDEDDDETDDEND